MKQGSGPGSIAKCWAFSWWLLFHSITTAYFKVMEYTLGTMSWSLRVLLKEITLAQQKTFWARNLLITCTEIYPWSHHWSKATEPTTLVCFVQSTYYLTRPATDYQMSNEIKSKHLPNPTGFMLVTGPVNSYSYVTWGILLPAWSFKTNAFPPSYLCKKQSVFRADVQMIQQGFAATKVQKTYIWILPRINRSP